MWPKEQMCGLPGLGEIMEKYISERKITACVDVMVHVSEDTYAKPKNIIFSMTSHAFAAYTPFKTLAFFQSCEANHRRHEINSGMEVNAAVLLRLLVQTH